MYETALNSDGSCVCSVTDAKLAQQVIYMGFDRCIGDRKIGRDLLVRATRNNSTPNFEFRIPIAISSPLIGVSTFTVMR